MEEEAWVGETLKEYERRRCTSKVLQIREEDVVGAGDNYGSTLKRLRLRVVLHSGDVEERRLVLKSIPATSPERLALAKQFGAFTKEVKVYRDVLSEMELMMGSGEPTLAPRFFGAKRLCEAILLEDLKESGYKMLNRREGMSFEHAKFAVQALSKFHALACILGERHDLNPKEYTSIFEESPEMMEVFMKNTLLDLAKCIESDWGKEWFVYGERVRKFANTLTTIVRAMFKTDETKFRTLNHGDFWLNNMMFKLAGDGTPLDVKFIDFQISYYNNPGLELQYFFQTSLDLDARRRKDQLLQEYHQGLEENLAKYGYAGKIPTFDDILELYKSAGGYGVIVGLATMPAMMMAPEDVPCMDELSKKFANKEEADMGFYKNLHKGKVLDFLKFVLTEAGENEYL